MSIAELQETISPNFDEDVLHKILCKKSGLEKVTVREIIFGPKSKKGDSYLSTVTKFVAKGAGCDGSGDNKEFEAHVIVKSIPKNIARRKTFRSIDFFKNEITFYEKVWPALKMFQESKNISNPFNSVPLCLASFSDGDQDFIALEDVSYQGYCTPARESGLDLAQAKVIVKVFARFHALSLAFKDQCPEEFEEVATSLEETYFSERIRPWYASTMSKFCVVIRDAVERQLPEPYSKKLNELLEQDLYGNIVKLCADRGPLAVITHGDCWVPNYLIKYDADGKTAVDTIMIDYQLARYSSLSMDILFFMYTCLEQSIRDQHWDTLLNEYQQTFSGLLGELGSDPNLLSLEMLKVDMKKYGVFAFGMCLEAIVVSLMEEEDVADIDMIKGDEAVPLHEVWVIRLMKNQGKRQRLADFFKHLVDNDLI